MNRRSFLGSLFKAAVVAAIAPEIIQNINKFDSDWKVYKINGYTINVKHNPIFDKKTYYPAEGFYPLESFKMIFLDNEEYKGTNR
jgi:hypothetical protein